MTQVWKKHEGRKSEDKFSEHTVDLSPAKEVCALPASRLLLSHPLLSSAMRFRREGKREKERGFLLVKDLS